MRENAVQTREPRVERVSAQRIMMHHERESCEDQLTRGEMERKRGGMERRGWEGRRSGEEEKVDGEGGLGKEAGKGSGEGKERWG
eukprot:3680494-Rhodomonas_salina.1